MKKILTKFLSFLLLAALLLPVLPKAEAYVMGEPYQADMSRWIENPERREYVEMMLDYYIRTDTMVQQALDGGFASVFMFDGCSDHMDDPSLSDLTFFRVTGVCIVVKRDAAGDLKVIYFNDDCSTIPDRPLEYGAWALPEVGDVGPATIFDGTYQLYSVRHKGKYEALHVRTEYWDMTLDAVYMTPEGYVTSRANEINIHTRTSNHTSSVGMWSAGCPLVGDGDSWEFWKLIEAVYYTTYDTFELDNFVGTLTIDRNELREKLYGLYEDEDAVDMFLSNSRKVQPEKYFQQCSQTEAFTEPKTMIVSMDTDLMSLPCSNATDARSQSRGSFEKDQKVSVLGSLCNSAGNLWYKVEADGQTGYVFSGHLKEESWFLRFINNLFQ